MQTGGSLWLWFTLALYISPQKLCVSGWVIDGSFGLMLLDMDTEGILKGHLFYSQRKRLTTSSCQELLDFSKTITLDLSPMLVF